MALWTHDMPQGPTCDCHRSLCLDGGDLRGLHLEPGQAWLTTKSVALVPSSVLVTTSKALVTRSDALCS